MDVSLSAADAAPTPMPPLMPPPMPPATVAATAATGAGTADPLLWAALLVWLSVEGIGDGLRALINVLAAAAASPTATPS